MMRLKPDATKLFLGNLKKHTLLHGRISRLCIVLKHIVRCHDHITRSTQTTCRIKTLGLKFTGRSPVVYPACKICADNHTSCSKTRHYFFLFLPYKTVQMKMLRLTVLLLLMAIRHLQTSQKNASEKRGRTAFVVPNHKESSDQTSSVWFLFVFNSR